MSLEISLADSAIGRRMEHLQATVSQAQTIYRNLGQTHCVGSDESREYSHDD